MHLVQLLLPITAPGEGQDFSEVHRALREELTARFGGMTAYSRAPAEGAWRPDDGTTDHDDIVILEVVTDVLDHAWWHTLRHRLERDLAQDAIHVRAMVVEML